MEDPKSALAILDQLYGMGVHLSIDDFGTGYSSLSALQQFPINTLKIDQSFVQEAYLDMDDATIVSTIIQMGRSLRMDVVAEGVETEEQLNFLRKQHCHFVQGHLFGAPLRSDDFLALLQSETEDTARHRILTA
jgi:EAL domain-containing protein (putative c-di-GMP-specific phosphodiesterase class I)